MNKRILLVVFIAVVLIAGSVFGQLDKKKYALLKPLGSDGKNEGIMIPLTAKEAKALLNKPAGLHKFSSPAGIMDTLHYVDGRGYSYFGGDPGDSFAVYFKPGAGCKILKVGFNAGYQSNDPTTVPQWQGINVSLNFVHYDGTSEPGGSGKYLLGEWTEAGQWVPTEWYGANFPSSPVSTAFWGPFPSSFVSDPIDQGEEVEMAWLGLEADNLGNDFAVVFVAYGNEGDQGAFEDSQSGITQQQRLWKWYISDRMWYLRHNVGFDVWCVVEFYENTPPVLSPGGPYGSVLTADARTLECGATDIDANDEAQAGVTEAKIVYKVNDGAEQDAAMTLVDGSITDGKWEGDIPAGALAPGDVVTFHFEMSDGGGLTSTSEEFSYGYFQKEAKILFYYNDGDQSVNPDYYWSQAPNLYDTWYGVQDGPATAALVNPYRWIVRVDGYSPQNLDSDVFEAWFASGTAEATKNVFWSSQEFLGAETGWEDTTYAEDDWHNMYLGVGALINDLQAAATGAYDQPWPINAVMDDPISGALAKFAADSGWQIQHDMPYEFGNYEWSDGFELGTDAVACFTDAASGTPMGIHKETATTKVVYLGFDQVALNMNAPYGTPGYTWPEYGYPTEGLSIIVPTLEWFEAPMSVDRFEPGMAKEYSLNQNYPNPFNPETKITYSLAKDDQVTLSVFNVLGQKVAELVNDHQAAGKYYVTWNANDLSSGVYFYRLETGDFTKTMKMMLLR